MPDSSWDAAWDERRYLHWRLTDHKELVWLKARAATFRAQLAESPDDGLSSLHLAEWNLENLQRRGELGILEAAIATDTCWALAKRMAIARLKARGDELAELLVDLENAAGAKWTRQFSFVFALKDVALLRAEPIGDVCCIGAELAGSDPGSEANAKLSGRLRQARMRIEALDSNQTADSMRDELATIREIEDQRETYKHIRCIECTAYQKENAFRHEEDGRVARTQRCQSCEFPKCETCWRKRKESEGPVLVREKEKKADGRREEGNWY